MKTRKHINNHDIKVLCVDDHKMVREAHETLLRQKGFDVLRGITFVEELIEFLDKTDSKPHVILLDIEFNDPERNYKRMSGLEGVVQLKKIYDRQIEIILVPHNLKHKFVSFAFENEISYVSKNRFENDIVKAIKRAAIFHKPYYSEDVREERDDFENSDILRSLLCPSQNGKRELPDEFKVIFLGLAGLDTHSAALLILLEKSEGDNNQSENNMRDSAEQLLEIMQTTLFRGLKKYIKKIRVEEEIKKVKKNLNLIKSKRKKVDERNKLEELELHKKVFNDYLNNNTHIMHKVLDITDNEPQKFPDMLIRKANSLTTAKSRARKKLTDYLQMQIDTEIELLFYLLKKKDPDALLILRQLTQISP